MKKGCKRGCEDREKRGDGAKKRRKKARGRAFAHTPWVNLACLLLLRLHTDSLVDNLHRELLGARDDLAAETERDVVVDDGRVATVLHHQHLDVLQRGHVHAVHAVVVAVAVRAVRPEADARHLRRALVAAAHRVIDTVRLPPPMLFVLKKKRKWVKKRQGSIRMCSVV